MTTFVLMAADTVPQAQDLPGILESLALGLLLGATGQGVRVIVGMKKLYDTAANSKQTMEDLFDLRQLVMSFVIGAIAGVCAVFGLWATKSPFDQRSLLGLVAAGYAGADFIEGFLSQWLPGNVQNQQATATQENNGSAKDDPNASPKPSAEAPPNG